MENFLFVFITITFLALMSAHVYLVNAFFNRLKDAHQALWKSMGEPKWKIHFGDSSFQEAMKYIRQKKFAELKDSHLDDLHKRIKLIERTSVALALLIMFVTVLDILQKG